MYLESVNGPTKMLGVVSDGGVDGISMEARSNVSGGVVVCLRCSDRIF